MKKNELILFIIQQLQSDLEQAISAAQATYQAATHEESKPENEYDTRGLEASYLAGAQAKRVAEIEETLYLFQHSELRSFQKDDLIAPTALVEVKAEGKNPSFVLIMAQGGGQTIHFQNHTIQVITPNSPLGEALIGMRVFDCITVEMRNQEIEYEILSIQ